MVLLRAARAPPWDGAAGLGTSTLSARAGAIAVRVTGFDRRGEGYAATAHLAP